jgi:hypothetical protein
MEGNKEEEDKCRTVKGNKGGGEHTHTHTYKKIKEHSTPSADSSRVSK